MTLDPSAVRLDERVSDLKARQLDIQVLEGKDAIDEMQVVLDEETQRHKTAQINQDKKQRDYDSNLEIAKSILSPKELDDCKVELQQAESELRVAALLIKKANINLTKAKNAYRSRDIFGRQTTMAVAQNIQHYVHYHDSLDEFYTDLDMYMAVTTDDIRRFAQKYLTPENSFTIFVTPKAATQAPVP